MKITERAREQLMNDQVPGIRLYFSGICCRSSKIGLALDEPEEDDEVILVNGIEVAVDPSIEYEVKGLTIDFNNDFILTRSNRESC